MKLIATATVATVAAAVFFFGVSHPYRNWDMIGYVASAHYEDGLRGEQLLAKTYADVEKEVSPEAFSAMSNGGDYSRGVHETATALEEQIPFYWHRVIYVWAIRELGVFGVSYPKATYFVSALFSALSVVALGIVCLRARISIFFLPLIALTTGYSQLARLSNPDSLAVFGSLLAIIASMRDSAWVYVLAAVLPSLRTEYVILSALLMLSMFARGRRLGASVGLAASLVSYLAVNLSHHSYGWLTLFNFTLVKRTAFPSRIVPSHDVRDYVAGYASAIWPLLSSRHFLIYLVSGCLLAFFRRTVYTSELYAHELFAIPMSFAVLHLALFPNYEERYFVSAASLILVWVLASLRSISALPRPTGA